MDTNKKAAIYKEVRMFWGAMQVIADRVGCHRNTVSRTLRQMEGFDREDIWEEAARYVLEKKQDKVTRRSNFEKLADAAQAIIL